ncbi:MAG: putative zinc-binding metallopeptidase [Dyadobacter sp.]
MRTGITYTTTAGNVLLSMGLCCLIILLFLSCKSEDPVEVEDVPGLGGDIWAASPIDKWIMDSLTVPYNISAKYKWDQFEFPNLTKVLVPPDESKVVPLLSAIRKAWTVPYVQEAGPIFYNQFSPKFFVLSGSNEYNLDGSVTLGIAEGGRKVVLFGVNLFKIKGMAGYDPQKDSSFVKDWFLHTIHHEFGHILHQTVLYPIEFTLVTKSLYQGGNWINWTDEQARQNGFITAYSSFNYNEDFVEMIAMMLTEGKVGFDKIVNNIPAGVSERGTTQEQAKAALRMKESIVVGYYRKTWNIDFYSLQNRVRASMNQLF